MYTGRSPGAPDVLRLSDVHGWGADAGIESTVKVLAQTGPSIAGQYVDLARTLDAFRVEMGPNERAVRGAVADCLSRGVLTDWLTSHEKEVVSIMITLYNEDEVLRNYVASERRKAISEGRAEGRAEGVIGMCKDFGLSAAQTVSKLQERLGITSASAQELVDRLW